MFDSNEASHAEEMLVFGPYRLDRDSGVLYRDGEEVPLPRKAVDVLLCLVEQPNRTVSKSALLERVWEGASVTDQSLVEAIRNLRCALGDDPRRPTYIKTAHRRGYRFIAAVSLEREPLTVQGDVRTPSVLDAAGRTLRHLALWEPAILRSSVAILLLVSIAATVSLWRARGSSPTASASAPTNRFTISLPQELPAVADVEISPDGKRIVYISLIDGRRQIVLKEADGFDFTPLAGTEGAYLPSFSPDSQALVFKAQGDRRHWTIKKLRLDGSEPITLADFGTGWPDLAWEADDRIYVARSEEGIYRLSPGGGDPEPLVAADDGSPDVYRFPQLLPDGRTLLFSSGRGAALLSLDSGDRWTLLEGVARAQFVPTGHLVYSRGGALWAMRFDTNALALRGQEVRLGEAVVGAVSDNGTFVYAGTPVHLDGDAAPATVRALRVDRDGTRGAVSLPSDGCGSPSLSPDGRRLALVCPGGGQRRDIAIGDLRRDLLTRWPSEGRDRSPVWTPDGTAIAYSSERDGVWRLQLRRVHGTQPAETLWESDQPLYPNSWHPDGRVLAVQRILPETGEDIWLLDVNGDRRPVAWLASPANESGARFSRDGKWIAYHSNESGSWHVYAAEYPGPGTKTQLSIESGGWPLWSRSGRELFYYANRPTGVLMVVDAGPAALLDPSRPRPLFDERLSIIRTRQGSAFDVGPEDDWFVVSGLEQRRVHTEIHVVFNWFDELRRRVPIER